ncbi:hypothetical protein HCUR_01109 [Holospora curviuscula]|uniref:Uncharacterized protein n=1 Tax=Holospora curviuscula TaxID=1082868 RepID=A0A2S5R814_9PROT|nr:hypothetical protein HCUR_01109 [Holospora curviuscula]
MPLEQMFTASLNRKDLIYTPRFNEDETLNLKTKILMR